MIKKIYSAGIYYIRRSKFVVVHIIKILVPDFFAICFFKAGYFIKVLVSLLLMLRLNVAMKTERTSE